MSSIARFRRAWWGIRQEFTWGWRHVSSGRSAYLANVIAYRLLAVTARVPGAGRVYRLSTDTGATLFYRRNRGDIQGIREIFIDEIYRLPDGARPESLVDLGANIGIATVWLCHEYQITRFVALEPLPVNFSVLERNCRANGLSGRLLRAAVGPQSGATTFDEGSQSNLGRIGSGELVVDVIGINELVGSLDFTGSLLKIDVEGMEFPLLAEADPSWIAIFSFVVMEMHPQYFDIGPLIETIKEQGFRYFEPVEVSVGTVRSKRERLFVREPTTLTR